MSAKFRSLDIEQSFVSLMRAAYKNVPIGSSQYNESRKLFIAGAWLMFEHFKFTGNMLSEDAGIKEMEQIEFQLKKLRAELSGRNE